jgi:hypothetical protein
VTDDQGGAIVFGLFAAFCLWKFWSGWEYGWTRSGRGWFARDVYRKEEPLRFAMAEALNLILGLIFGTCAGILAMR